jgi:flagellar motor switch/type III secretory pathway protein FliN
MHSTTAEHAAARRPLPPAWGARQPVLPRLDRVQLELRNHLLARARHCEARIADRLQEWRWCDGEVSSAHAIELVLADGTSECVLAIHGESHAGIDAGIDLVAFEGEALVLAATLRYAGVVAHLAALSARRWQCVDVVHASGTPQYRGPEYLRFAFELRDAAAGAARFGEPGCTQGHVRLHREEADRWTATFGSPAPASALLQTVPIALKIVLRTVPPLTPAELRAIKPGGGVLIGRGDARSLACTLALPGRSGFLAARLQGQRLTVCGPLTRGAPPHPPTSRRPAMHSPADADDTNAALAANPDDDASPPADNTLFDAVPVALEFHIGHLTLPFGDLAAELAEGRIFDLGEPLGTQSVSVRAGGVELARGELLQVGDALAVRITRMG